MLYCVKLTGEDDKLSECHIMQKLILKTGLYTIWHTDNWKLRKQTLL